MADGYNRIEFKLIIHFLCSCIQLISILAILALQIALTITQTCVYRIGVGFWSFPFLIIAPISIWILLWKRNLTYCFIVFIIHICSNLFATGVIIISLLVLIERIVMPCSIPNIYSLPINVSLVVVSFFLKLFLYGEIIAVYIVRRGHRESTKQYQIILDNQNMNTLKVDINKYKNLDV